MTLRIAITGTHARPDNPGPGVAVARCLREAADFAGELVALGYDAMEPGLYRTDLFSAAHLLPYPSAGEDAYFQRLLSIHLETPIDLLLPCLDAELPLLQRLRERLWDVGILAVIPTPEQLGRRNKDRLPELCRIVGLATPRTQAILSARFFDDCAGRGWNFPLVVKGSFYDAGVAYSPAEAAYHFQRIAADWGLPLLVQEKIEGEEVNLVTLGDGRGGMVQPVMMCKKGLTDKGKAWAGMTIRDEKLAAAARKLVRALRWRGPLEVEMIRDRKGRHYLIEVNPRFPAWIYLAAGVGSNLPWLWVQMMWRERVPPRASPKPGTLFIRYAEERIISLEEFGRMAQQGSAASADGR